jgi:hypothetical protein
MESQRNRLNEQLHRNRKRFPNDFMFRLTKPEAEALRSQFAISNTSQEDFEVTICNLKDKRKTRAGAGGVICPMHLRNRVSRCCRVFLTASVQSRSTSQLLRAFVKLRQLLESNEELNHKFAAVLRKLATHDKYFTVVFDELKKLNEPPARARKQIGFKTATES